MCECWDVRSHVGDRDLSRHKRAHRPTMTPSAKSSTSTFQAAATIGASERNGSLRALGRHFLSSAIPTSMTATNLSATSDVACFHPMINAENRR